MSVSIPAFAEGPCTTLICVTSETARQFPLLVEVRVSVTTPAVLSAGLRVYVALSVELLGKNVPLPDVVQMPVEAPPEIEPFKVADMVPAHTDWKGPASTFGDGVMMILSESEIAAHPLREVKVMVTLPVSASIMLGT